jgi:hypothetical protein
MYAKILVGQFKGQTLYITSMLNDECGTIGIKVDGKYFEYQTGQYELVKI